VWRRLDCADDLFQNLCCFLKSRALLAIERGDLFCQCADAAGAAFHQELLSGGSGGDECAAAVVCILLFEDEALFFEGVDDACHGGRANLLGCCEVAEADVASEDDDGEGGETWSVEARAFVFFAEFSQQVDGGGVKLVGDIFRIYEDFV
jgi:hypothetical protein